MFFFCGDGFVLQRNSYVYPRRSSCFYLVRCKVILFIILYTSFFRVGLDQRFMQICRKTALHTCIRMEGTSRRKLRSRSRSFGYLAFLFTLTCSQAVLAECKCTHMCDYQRAVERCAEKFVNSLFLSFIQMTPQSRNVSFDIELLLMTSHV